jgi:hypothetical protein
VAGLQQARPSRGSLCPWCSLLVLDPPGRRGLPRVTHHRDSRFKRMRTPEGRKWWADRVRLRRLGLSAERIAERIGAFPPLPAEKLRHGRKRAEKS